jgi:hypothetical protein
MTTKEAIKKEIDQLPENLLGEVDRFIHSLLRARTNPKPLRSRKLQGRFDQVSIRKQAYE